MPISTDIPFIVATEIFFLLFIGCLLGGTIGLFIIPINKKTKPRKKLFKKLLLFSIASLLIFFFLTIFLRPSNTINDLVGLFILLISIGIGITILIAGINIIVDIILLLSSLFIERLKSHRKLLLLLLIFSFIWGFMMQLLISFMGPHFCGFGC